jgi:hypothetical protein
MVWILAMVGVLVLWAFVGEIPAVRRYLDLDGEVLDDPEALNETLKHEGIARRV